MCFTQVSFNVAALNPGTKVYGHVLQVHPYKPSICTGSSVRASSVHGCLCSTFEEKYLLANRLKWNQHSFSKLTWTPWLDLSCPSSFGHKTLITDVHSYINCIGWLIYTKLWEASMQACCNFCCREREESKGLKYKAGLTYMRVSLHPICITGECEPSLNRAGSHKSGATAVRIAEGSCASLGLVQVQIQAKIQTWIPPEPMNKGMHRTPCCEPGLKLSMDLRRGWRAFTLAKEPSN